MTQEMGPALSLPQRLTRPFPQAQFGLSWSKPPVSSRFPEKQCLNSAGLYSEQCRSVFRLAQASTPQPFPVFLDFLKEVKSSWQRLASAPSVSKCMAALASLEGAEAMGLAQFPPVDSTIAALVRTPPVGGLAKDPVCPNGQCRITEAHLKLAYAAEAQVTCLANTGGLLMAYLDGARTRVSAAGLHLVSESVGAPTTQKMDLWNLIEQINEKAAAQKEQLERWEREMGLAPQKRQEREPTELELLLQKWEQARVAPQSPEPEEEELPPEPRGEEQRSKQQNKIDT
ncbi:UNVERIFIED_CONTAM: hypothetical protein FKN15_026415 [Acipenser sinensis]